MYRLCLLTAVMATFQIRLPHTSFFHKKLNWAFRSPGLKPFLISLPSHYRRMKIIHKNTVAGQRGTWNWATVKLQSSELTPVTRDKLSHQTTLRHQKTTHTHISERHQKYPSQLTRRSNVTAIWGAAMEGGWSRVGTADTTGQGKGGEARAFSRVSQRLLPQAFSTWWGLYNRDVSAFCQWLQCGETDLYRVHCQAPSLS